MTHGSLGKYPAEVVAQVRHLRASDPTISDIEALTRVFAENPLLYRRYDERAKRGLAPQPVPKEPKAFGEVEVPDSVQKARSNFNAGLALFADDKGLNVDDPATSLKFCETPQGARAYARLDAAQMKTFIGEEE